MRRTVIPELLDIDAGMPGEIAASLADLKRISRWFGSVSTLARLVRRIAKDTGQKNFTMLDVGSGPGDVARSLREELSCSGIGLQVSLLDQSTRHLSNHHSKNRVAANALALPFREKSFDLVACSTFAHHLEPNELIEFVNRALNIARTAVLINDLRRSTAHLALVYMGFPLFRSRITRHDAPASVRRAYTPEEMEGILKQTAAARIEISNHYLYRMGAIAWAN